MLTSSEMKVAVGKRLREFRVTNHYTQAQFAELIDISVNFLSEIETGKKGMSQDTIWRICSYFHISADFLLFGNEKEEEPSKKITELGAALSEEELDLVLEYLGTIKKLREKGM
ncbi:MAG: helix-turn-helix transcriptional regulator [Lachnospiraceae bacterium]|nr:helix-turn-helix transcriptional regulator [Lachnospiraceae bacterium]